MKSIYFCACTPDGGVYHYREKNGVLSFSEKYSLPNPMYMTVADSRAYVLLRETEAKTHFGGLISFDCGTDGRLGNPSMIQSTGGIEPCHLSVRENDVYAVNYSSGSVLLMPDKLRTHQGSGPNPSRQEAPHPHFVTVSPDGCEVLCVDLGLDAIVVYDRLLNEKYRVRMPAGFGPRHLAFSPDGRTLYCVHELACAISVLNKRGGRWESGQSYFLLEKVTPLDTAAAIRVRDDQIYISVRGADVLVRFAVENNSLRLMERTPCGGKSPRDFALIGNRLYCANEGSNTVTIFRLQNNRPVLLTEKICLPHPLCICEGKEQQAAGEAFFGAGQAS